VSVGEDICPSCRVDFTYEVDGKTYSRRVGVEIPGLYDGVAYWECPSCGYRWARFHGPGRVNDFLAREGILNT